MLSPTKGGIFHLLSSTFRRQAGRSERRARLRASKAWCRFHGRPKWTIVSYPLKWRPFWASEVEERIFVTPALLNSVGRSNKGQSWPSGKEGPLSLFLESQTRSKAEGYVATPKVIPTMYAQGNPICPRNTLGIIERWHFLFHECHPAVIFNHISINHIRTRSFRITYIGSRVLYP